ncbi:MAG: ParB/RepB/Spo0J family partition protein [Gemmatimonadota bacterium]
MADANAGGGGTGRRDRLGKGLGALLGEYLGEETPSGEVRDLSVGAISPNPFQPRREFAEEELAELAASIGENGLLQPIVVRPAAEGSAAGWELVAGERRWRAVTRLGWKRVPAIVRELDDRALLVLALVENLQRASLSPLEEAAGYRQLAQDFDLSQQQIAEAVGRDRSTVANTLRLLQLPGPVRELVERGRLTAGHARALLAIADERRMVELGRRAVADGWSVREVEARVKREREDGGKPAGSRKERGRDGGSGSREPAERRLEEALQRALGTPARIRRTRKARGRIEVPFYGPEDFERVFELLAGRPVDDVVS